jgi:hypothetical protein
MTAFIVIIAVVAVVIVFIALKSRSVVPAQRAEARHEAGDASAFEGKVNGVGYTVERYSSDIVTVEIAAPGGVARPLEVNARKMRPALMDERKGEIEALLDMGADYIDVGFNTDRVAAEFPATRGDVGKGLAEKAVHYLVVLRERSR